MKNLLWKQWRENRGYLAIFLLWMVLAACYCLSYELTYQLRAIVGQFSGWTLMYSIFAAVFLAMYVALGERTAGTIGFSRALPVSTRQQGAYRISGAVCTLAIPILVAAVIISLALIGGLVEQVVPRISRDYVTLEDRSSGSLMTSLQQLWCVAFIGVFGGVELLLVLSLIGSRLRSQAQVGFLGAVLGLGSIIAGSLLWYDMPAPNAFAQLAYGAVLPQSLVIQWGYSGVSGSYTDHEFAPYPWISLTLAIPVLLLLGRLFVAQYGRYRKPIVARQNRFRYLTPAIFSYIKLRFRSRWTSLLWSEMRQSVPLVIFGLLFVFLLTLFTALIESQQFRSYRENVRSMLPHYNAFTGMLWASVVGSGIFAAQLDPRLGAFWRSRPISPAMWFWSKYLVGWLAVVLILDGITSLVSWTADRGSMTTGMSWTYVACIPLLHTLMYSLSVFGTCWFRKPVLGGFLAVAGFLVVSMLLEAFPMTRTLDPIHVYNQLLSAEREGTIDFAQYGYPLVYGGLLVGSLVFARLSSRLVRPLESRGRFLGGLMASP